MKWIAAPAAGLTLAVGALAISGCGGGSHSQPSNSYSYSGTVTDQSGDPIPGDTVSFDGTTAHRATTNSSGAFTISGVPTTSATGTDTLIVSDSTGAEVAEFALPNPPVSESGIAITVGPPAPPSSLVAKP